MERSCLRDDESPARSRPLPAGRRWERLFPAWARPLPLFMAVPAFAALVAMSNPRVPPPQATGFVHDMRGQAVPVALPASRVLIFPPLFWAYLTVDGGADHMPAAVAYQKADIRQGLLRHVFPAAADLPDAATLGRDSAIPGDPEQIMALKADAIFSWSQFSGVLKKIGAPVVQFALQPTGDERDQNAMWRLMGAIAGKPDRVERLMARYHEERDRVLAPLAGMDRRPRVLYVYQTSPLLVAFDGTREARLLDAIGAVNVAAGLHGPALGKEQLLLLAPDIIVLAGFDTGNATRAIYGDPALRGLPAVKARRVYRQPTGGAHMAGLVEDPLMLQWLAEVVHPDVAPRRFRQDVKATYAAVYGADLSDDAIDGTLHLDENADAAGFDRFGRHVPSSTPEKCNHVP